MKIYDVGIWTKVEIERYKSVPLNFPVHVGTKQFWVRGVQYWPDIKDKLGTNLGTFDRVLIFWYCDGEILD